MRKILTTLTVLAAAGAVHAQSSLTLFGVVDTALQHGSGSVSNRTHLTPSGNQASRLGLRGTEDLGGGMSASFWLEADVRTDDGTGAATNTNNQASGGAPAGGLGGGQGLTFNRRSTVSLAGSWGEVRLGRDYTTQFLNLTVFDPFGTLGVGTAQTLVSGLGGPVAARASNSVGYLLPGNLGGLYGLVQYYLGENPSGTANAKDGRGGGIRVGYASGPFNVALATSSTEYLAGDIRQTNLGGRWNFGFATVMGHYVRDRVNSAVPVTGRGALIGVQAPVGTGEIRASYASYHTNAVGSPKTRKLAMGYVHHLSKRTAVYATLARADNSGGARVAFAGAVTGPNNSSNGYDLGLRHAF
jgi:predicted porin